MERKNGGSRKVWGVKFLPTPPLDKTLVIHILRLDKFYSSLPGTITSKLEVHGVWEWLWPGNLNGGVTPDCQLRIYHATGIVHYQHTQENPD